MVAQIDWRYFRTRPSKTFNRLLGYAFFEGRPLTTRGQWFNPVVRGTLALGRAFPAKVSASRPIYILGAGRSGTTVLGTILSLHREVAYLNEPKLLWHEAYPTEDIIGSYSAEPGRLILRAEDASPATAESVRRMYGAYLAATGTTRVVDKYPELVFRVDFIRALFPEARFVLIVRSGFDTSASIADWSETHGLCRGRESHDWWGAADRKWRVMVDELGDRLPDFGRRDLMRIDDLLLRGAIEWTLTMQVATESLARHRDQMMFLRYEDLVEDSTRELRRMFAFTGLATDKHVERYAREILRPVAQRPRPEIAENLRPAFMQMMEIFGYRM